MSHMVIFQTPDGNPGYNQFEQLEEAVRFVENLRNEQGVENARMFALEEVKFDFKQYFKVELDPPMVGAAPAPVPSAPGAYIVPPSAPATAPPSANRGPTAPVFTPPAPERQYADASTSPIGNEPAMGDVPPPTFMSPPNQPEAEAATGRRGLFGR